jgi:PTH1 family peptidyl-tRNA hydrolase
MNLSGVAVRKVLARERVALADLVVVVDDMALPFGKLRLRERGSAGGHNGLRSIIGEMGTEDFARLRVGIGKPPEGAIDHVLGDFAHAEQRHLDAILDAAADAVELWAREGPHRAANRWNAWQLDLPDEAAAGATTHTPVETPIPDGHGIVRTATGWRKLLPGHGRDEGRRS